MCSEYEIRTSFKRIEKQLGAKNIKNILDKDEWNDRVRISRSAPVLVGNGNSIELTQRLFPVRPFPNSRLSQSEGNRSKSKIPEAEEKIVRIYDTKSWKKGFTENPCLVPMTRFFEAAYWGPNKGDIVAFTDPQEEVLFVPAIQIKPQTPPSKDLNGFSLLTHTASEQMLKYHHRLLVLLRPADAFEYLTAADWSAGERFSFLVDRRYVPKFEIETDRHMAKGWEKRVEEHEGSLKRETSYLAALERESVSG